MRLSTVKIAGRTTWGVVEGETFRDAGAILADRYADLKAAITAGLAGVAEAAAKAPSFELSQLEWLPVIPNPDKILCVGLNYEMHRKETGRAEVDNPTIFGRFANSQTGHLKPILRPKVSTELDYEGELAVIIGSRAGTSPVKTRLDTLRVLPATTTAACATISAIRISSRLARTSPRLVLSARG